MRQNLVTVVMLTLMVIVVWASVSYSKEDLSVSQTITDPSLCKRCHVDYRYSMCLPEKLCSEYCDSCRIQLKYSENSCPIQTPAMPVDYALCEVRPLSEVDWAAAKKELDSGKVLIVSTSEEDTGRLMYELMEQTRNGCLTGWPDYKDIMGPVFAMAKKGDEYCWMMDWPHKYTPSNSENYIGTTNELVSGYAFDEGCNLLRPTDSVCFFDKQ